ncbi:MAG: asparagine synthase (glutamine-hydrolyzing) [Flavisolibacter sp.]
MCGIAGILSPNTRFISKERIENAISCLHHRGPEGKGTWMNQEQNIVLAHSRLSIIDLSENAAQPLHYLNRYTIIHNGELYNYLEIKKQLQQNNYVFKTDTDTEVIVAAYDAWKDQCLHQFDGMFAFAIWDEQEKKLFSARDRFGEKPFFFYYDSEQFCFASEMRSLWSLGIKKHVNPSMLYNFLTIGYTGNPSDPGETFYEDIQKLPAASCIVYDASDHKLQIERYWQVNTQINQSISENDAIVQFRHLLQESVSKRLRSDVPVGTSLSGGLDSSSIVSFCDEVSSNQYSHKCFTATFKGFEKDELKFAKIIADKFNLQHYAVEIDDAGITDLMNRVMQTQEEPFSSSSVLAQFKVFENAKQNGVTVLLDGQGADEVLGGYHKYYKWYWQELYRNKKLGSSKELEYAKTLGVQETFSLQNKLASRFPEFAASMLQSRKSKHAFSHPDLNHDFAFSQKRNLYYSLPTHFDLNGVLYFNSFVYGLEELLRLADRNSMAHAIELRLPFLSHKLVEFLFTLPAHFKIHQGWTKWLLRKTMDKELPDDIVWRKDKTGFEPPQKKWMEDPKVMEAIMEGKRKLASHQILNDAAVHKKIQPHSAYAADHQDWKYWSASFLFD